MGFTPVDMVAPLSGRNHIREVFYGAGTNEGFPMSSPRSCGESRGSENDIHLSHGTVELGKPQIITNGKTDTAKRRVQGYDAATCFDRFFLGIAFVPELQAE